MSEEKGNGGKRSNIWLAVTEARTEAGPKWWPYREKRNGAIGFEVCFLEVKSLGLTEWTWRKEKTKIKANS